MHDGDHPIRSASIADALREGEGLMIASHELIYQPFDLIRTMTMNTGDVIGVEMQTRK
jgi:hypothetical protein